MFKIAIINGSVQKKNYTAFVLKVIKDEIELNENFKIIEINLIDYNLPFPGTKIENDNSSELRKFLKSADAFVLGTPEYNGSFTAKLKLMIENSGFPSALKGKPVSLIGIASGILGAVKSLEHLRSVCAHIGAFTLPRVVSIANIEDKFNIKGNCVDIVTEMEIKTLAKNLISYCKSINK